MLKPARWECALKSSSALARLPPGRSLLTLAIETSCDDTSVAVLEKHNQHNATLHFHEKVTADNARFRGVHPIASLESHQSNLGNLIIRAIHNLPLSNAFHSNATDLSLHRRNPNLICVTRGPGMRSSLFTGLDTAKGLAIAWQIPLIGVNHMQSHALTPCLVAALEHDARNAAPPPTFPFLSLLVSGGHTLLVKSTSLTNHSILATTDNIAIGDALDKIARAVLPSEIVQSSRDIMYGRLLERFVFSSSAASEDPEYVYTPPTSRAEELIHKRTKWGWALPTPFADTRQMKFSFSGLESECKRIMDSRGAKMEEEERRELGREAMRVAFEHLASRVIVALQSMDITLHNTENLNTLVVSGGVASNTFLRVILRAYLSARGYKRIQLSFPPVELCTDNAAMIGWTGIEMYEAGYQSELSCQALRKWSIDPNAEDGGILGVEGWKSRNTNER